MKEYKRVIALVLIFLIFSTSFSYAAVTGTSDTQTQQENIPPGEDILINVAGYEPKIVPQQAFETDDYKGYTVYALLNGVKTNPFIDIDKIRTINYRVQGTNVPGVQAYARPPPYKYSLDNMGLLLVRLPKIKDERKIPNKIDINITATILYDIGSGFGVSETGLNIPQLSNDDFQTNKEKYSFWAGRGYVKADLLDDNRATFTIYDGRLMPVRSGISLVPGQESSEISLYTGSLLPQYGENAINSNIRDRFKIKLDYIAVSKDKVKLQILVNNKFITEELSENQRLYEGSSWKIIKIDPTETQDIITLSNTDTGETAILTGSKESVISCEGITTENLCKALIQPKCTWDSTLNKCLSSTTSSDSGVSVTGLSAETQANAEKDTNNAITEFNKLKVSNSQNLDDYKKVIDLFKNVLKNYPNTVYAQLARSYITNLFYNDITYVDIKLKTDVENYLADYIAESGLNVPVSEGSTSDQSSRTYYLKAIEDYKNVILNKYDAEKGQKEYSLEAQTRIATIYDYYLNDVDKAIQAYNELINNYELADLQKITYESRIKFLETTRGYKTQPIDIYEDGNLVRVVLNGVDRVSEKPVAYISIDNKDAQAFKEGDKVIDFGDHKYSLESIDSGKIILISNTTSTFNQQPIREEFDFDKNKLLEGKINLRFVRADTKKEAHVTVSPVLKSLTSISNFQVHIPIERRAIKLSNEQIDSQVDFAKNLVSKLDSAINTVEHIYQYMSYYCYTVFTVLFIKNFAQGLGGRTFAREQVIDEWKKACDENNFEDCILKHASEFDDEVSKMGDAVSRSDKIFTEIKNVKKNKASCDTLTSKLSGYLTNFADLNNMDPGLVIEYCNRAQVDSNNEIINEREIRSDLLKREQATFKWGDVVKESNSATSIVHDNIKGFIDGDLSLRNDNSLKSKENELKSEFLYDDGKTRDWKDVKLSVGELKLNAAGIDENKWNDKNTDQISLVNNYIRLKRPQLLYDINKQAIGQEGYYTKALNPNNDESINTEISNVLNEKISVPSLQSSQDVLNNPSGLPNLDTTNEIAKRLDIDKFDSGDWYLGQRPIFVIITQKDTSGKTNSNTETLANYLVENKEANAAFNGGDFNKLQNYIQTSASGTYLVTQQAQSQTNYRTLLVKDLPIVNTEFTKEITLEDNKLKTITINDKYLLEVERNSQGIITQLSLFEKGYDGVPDGFVKTFAYNQCSRELSTYATQPEITKVCSDIRNIESDLYKKDPSQIGAKLRDYAVKGAVQKTGVLECVSVMGAQDCLWLFSACDPVFCPPSRFNYNGHRVDNVVSSGIFGSIYLGWGLWRPPGNPPVPPEVGICVPGVLAD